MDKIKLPLHYLRKGETGAHVPEEMEGGDGNHREEERSGDFGNGHDARGPEHRHKDAAAAELDGGQEPGERERRSGSSCCRC